MPRTSSEMITLARSIRDHEAFMPPKQVQIEITNLCNLRCVMCDRWTWIKENTNLGGNLTTEKLRELFDDFSRIGVKRVLLTGGEPLLRRDLCELIEHLRRKCLDITIFTNGACVTSKAVEALAEARAVVLFSLDGSCPEVHDEIRGVDGTFRRVVEGVQRLAQVIKKNKTGKGKVMINCVVQKRNIEDLPRHFKLACKLGADTVFYAMIHGRPEEALDETSIEPLRESYAELERLAETPKTHLVFTPYLKLFISAEIPVQDVKAGMPALSLFKSHQVPCFTAYTSALIDAFGYVYPCCYAYFDNQPYGSHLEQRKHICLGNVHEKRFADIWYGEKYNKFRILMDPVNVERLASVCGQCERYFDFKQLCEWIELLRND